MFLKHTYFIRSTTWFYMINIQLLVSRFGPWFPRTQSIIFANKLPFYIVTQIFKNWIYHNYAKLFYKPNFEIYIFFLIIVQIKQTKIHSWFFFQKFAHDTKKYQSFERKGILMSLFNDNSKHIYSQTKWFNDLTPK